MTALSLSPPASPDHKTAPLIASGAGAPDPALPDPTATKVPEMAHNCTYGFIKWYRSDEVARNCFFQMILDVVVFALALLMTATVAGIPFVWLAFQENGVQKAEVFYKTHPPKGMALADDLEAAETSLKTAADDNAALMKKVAEAEKAAKVAQDALSGAQAEASTAKAEANKAKGELLARPGSEDLRKLKDALAKAETDLGTQTAELVALKQQQATFNEDFTRLTKERDDANKSAAAIKTELGTATTKLKQAEAAKARLEGENKAKHDQADVDAAVAHATSPLQEQIAALAAEKEKLSKALSLANQQVASLDSKVKAASNSGKEVSAQVAELTAQVSALSGQLQAKTDEAASLAFSAEKLKEIEPDYAKMLIQLPGLKSQLDAAKTALTAAKNELATTVAAKDGEIAVLQDKVSEQGEQLVKRTTEHEKAVDTINKMKTSYESLHSKFVAEVNATKNAQEGLAELSAKFEGLAPQVAAGNAAVAQVGALTKENTALVSAKANLEAQLATAKANTASADALAAAQKDAAAQKAAKEELAKQLVAAKDKAAAADALQAQLADAKRSLAAQQDFEAQKKELLDILAKVQSGAPLNFKGAFEENVTLKTQLASKTLEVSGLSKKLADIGLVTGAKAPAPAPKAEGKKGS